MAKALYGHLAGNDARLAWENDRLRSRVADLEAEVERLTLELAAAGEVITDDMPTSETFVDAPSAALRHTLA